MTKQISLTFSTSLDQYFHFASLSCCGGNQSSSERKICLQSISWSRSLLSNSYAFKVLPATFSCHPINVHSWNSSSRFVVHCMSTGSETKTMNQEQVQELARNCNEIPERYIRKQDEEYAGHITNASASSLATAHIPVIDFSLLTSSSPVELDRLKSAIDTWGCFQAINHGINLEKVREISRLFFKLPAEEKRKYMREENDFEGYGNDMVLSDHQTLDWADRLYLTVLPQDQQQLQFWPQSPSHFREVLDEYSSNIELIKEIVLKALARLLNLEEDCFLNQYGTTATMQARFNYYPPCPWPEKVLGVKPHADSSAITVLLQDKEVEGLQLLKDDQWLRVPIVHDALTINIGDQIEIMSNGIFKSPVHRVLVNSQNERMTLAMFCTPQTEKDIGPVEGLITDETPRLYKNVTYGLNFFFKYFQQGKRPIDACKI